MNVINADVLNIIPIGRQGENAVTAVKFGTFGDFVPVLNVQRPTDTAPYPAELVRDGDAYTWTVSNTDTAFKGDGLIQVVFMDGDAVKKTQIYKTIVAPALAPSGETPPDPLESWYQNILRASADAIRAVTDAGAQADRANTQANRAESEADRASGYVTQASAQANRAGQQAQQAGTYVTQASAQADRARDEANNASGYVTQAQAQATQAGVYAGNSQTSAEASQQAFTDFLNMLDTDVPTLVNGKIPADQIPSIATTEVYSVATIQQRDALQVERGDICIVTGENKSYIYNGNGWVYLASPTDYASRAGYAETAGTAETANKINNHRLIEMNYSEFITAVKDPNTYYIVWSD